MRDLSITKILAGALAAASAAVASSWLGVAGTVLGAVVVSIIASVATALYAHPIEKSSRVLIESIPVRDRLPRLAREDAPTEVLPAEAAEPDATQVLVAEPPPPGGAEPASPGGDRPRRQIRWKAVAVTSIASLLLGFAVLTGVELLIGKPLTSLTDSDQNGRTTVLRIVEGDSGKGDQPATDSPSKPSFDEPATPGATQPTGPANSTQPTQPTEPAPTTPTESTEPTPTQPDGSDPAPTTPPNPGGAGATEPLATPTG